MDRYTPEQRREYMRVYREKRKLEAMRILGGKCVRCGATGDLHFDHIDPLQKEFHISGFWQSRAKMLDELKKCQLLCGPHHREKTAEENRIRFTKPDSV